MNSDSKTREERGNGTTGGVAPAAPAFQFSRNNFDLIRLFAATQVLLSHGSYYLAHHHIEFTWFLAGGFYFWPIYYLKDFPGVPIFFVISGFLISASYERSQNLPEYFRNRFLRIYPALWVCLAFSVAVVLAFRVPFTLAQLAKWLLAQTTIVQFYNPAFLRDFGIGSADGGTAGMGALNGSLWTIPVELQFYICFPLLFLLLAKILRKKPEGAAALGAFLVFLGIAAWVHLNGAAPLLHALHATTGIGLRELGFLLNETVLPHFYLFLFGWVLQKNFHRLRPFFVDKGFVWLGAYIGFLMFTGWVLNIHRPTETWRIHTPFGTLPVELFSRLFLGCVTISCAYTLAGAARRILRGTDISYGVYIYHMVLINVFVMFGWHGHNFAWTLPLLAATYAIAWLSWRFVEKPALAHKHRTIKNAKTTA
ncbi:MAG: acyltransferase [Puniceicoccales bacterium]|jgi:peptidoglycan/LPS O-acetylase OafA/YrhL|nr:acyltransferase [Puniceicoccales bacterium]